MGAQGFTERGCQRRDDTAVLDTREQKVRTTSHWWNRSALTASDPRSTKLRDDPVDGVLGMSSESRLGTSGPEALSEPLAWSEDPLTAWARSVWTAGDLLPIAQSFAPGAEEFIARLALCAGESVLDVVISFDVGDAESLPYADGQFDTTVTMFGAMFAYRPERAAAELIRVTRRGGRVAMANWTPEGLIGKLLRVHTALVPTPPGVPSPLGWGEADAVSAHFRGRVSSVSCTRRTLELRFPFPPAGVTELLATCYGPTITTLRATDPDGASRLREELTRLFQQHNLANNGTTTVSGEYLDVLARVA